MKKILTALLTTAASSGEKITVFKDKSDKRKDEMHDEKNGCSDYDIPNPKVESHVTLIADV